MSLYPPPATVKAEPFARVPDRYRKQVRTAWADANKAGAIADCFLEGPSFDRAGNLWVTDIPHGRIFKDLAGRRLVACQRVRRLAQRPQVPQGRPRFITDYKRGIMVLDPATGKVTPLIETVRSESFKGVNDLHLRRPTAISTSRTRARPGCTIRRGGFIAFRRMASSTCLVNTIPSPNGIVLDLHEKVVLVAVTRANAIWRIPLMIDGGVSKVGVAAQLSGGLAGPDGLALDEEGGLVIAHPGMGCWRFDRLLRPTHFIEPPDSIFVTNAAFDGKRLYMTESESGTILVANLPVAGKRMYGQMD